MKNKFTAAALSVVIALLLWLYVITTVSPGSKQTFYNIPLVLGNESVLTERGLMITYQSASSVTLELSGNRREGITLRCGNDLTDLSAAIPGSKLGLVGITERAQMLGGRLDAGVRGGRFEVEAWLPWETDFRRTP